MSDSTVLVTGASGFVGGRIVELCALGHGPRPRAAIRAWNRAARVARFPVDIAICDIMDPQQIAAAMDGIEYVVHCAYVDDARVIVEGTRNMLTAARDAGVRRFVFLSTAEVYGQQAAGEIDEHAPCQHSGWTYADGKIDAENLCREFHADGLPVTILRPSIVYGPFGRSWTIGVTERLQSGRWAEFDKYGEGYCNAVYVDDLASAVLLALEVEAAAGETFNINGPAVGTWNEYFRCYNDTLGLAPLQTKSARASALRSAVTDRFSAVTWLFVNKFYDRLMEIYLRGGPTSRLMKRVKALLNSTPTTKELENLYSRRALYVDRKAHDLLGYRPAYNLEAGVRMSVAWMAHHGLVDPAAIAPPSTGANGQPVTTTAAHEQAESTSPEPLSTTR